MVPRRLVMDRFSVGKARLLQASRPPRGAIAAVLHSIMVKSIGVTGNRPVLRAMLSGN